MLIITDTGKTYLKTLQKKSEEFETYSVEINRIFHYDGITPLERKRLLDCMNSRMYRFAPQLSVLYRLDNEGPLERKAFYVPEYQQLQEGWCRRHDQSRDRVVDILIAKGYVTETK